VWPGDCVARGALAALLVRTTELPTEPELQFEPEANASYDLAAKVIDTIVDSGVTRLGFVGNERYREFSRN
jgi:biopolymer transport protein ExbD